MSVVDDLRKLLQDLVTPDLRALGVRVEHVEKRLENLEHSIAEMRTEMRSEIRQGISQITDLLRLNQHLTSMEDRLSAVEDRQRKELPERGQQ